MEASVISWFESICSLLSRNPAEATRKLNEFQESEQAFEISIHILTHSIQPDVQFQSLIVLQNSTMRKWNKLTQDEITTLRNLLWQLFQTPAVSSFVVNKAMQVFAQSWRRSWIDESKEIKQNLFNQISSTIRDINSAKLMSELLRVFIEEFSRMSKSSAALPLEFYRKTYLSFESFGLDQIFQISFSLLSNGVQTVLAEIKQNNNNSSHSSGHNFSSDVLLLREIDPCNLSEFFLLEVIVSILSAIFIYSETLYGCKLMLACNGWEIGNAASLLNDSIATSASQLSVIQLPSYWIVILLQPQFMESLFECYEKLQDTLLTSTSTSTSFQYLETLTEIRQLMITFSSISITSLATIQAEQGRDFSGFGNRLLNLVIPLVNRIKGHATGEAIRNEFLFDLISQECTGIASLVLKFIANFKLLHICQMTNFETFVVTLAHSCLSLSTYISHQAELQLQPLLGNTTATTMTSSGHGSNGGRDGSSNGNFEGMEAELMESWRGDVLSILLDSWCLLLEDPLLTESYYNERDNNITQTFTNILRNNLDSIAADVFQSLFQSVLKIELSSSLRNILKGNDAEDEDEDLVDVQHEEIGSRSIEDLLVAMCTIGRASLSSSLQTILDTISNVLEKFQYLMQFNLDPQNATSTSAQMKVQSIYVIETLRISILFSSYLCFDNFSSEFESNKICRETPVIPILIINTFINTTSTSTANNNTKEGYQIIDKLKQLINYYVQMLQYFALALTTTRATNTTTTAASSGIVEILESPLLIQLLLRFLSEYIKVYLAPDPSNYSKLTLQAAPLAFQIHGSEFTDVISVTLQTSAVFLQTLAYQSDVIISICDILRSLSYQKQYLVHLINSNEMKVFYDYLVNRNNNLPLGSLENLWTATGTLLIKGSSATGNNTILNQLLLAIESQSQPYLQHQSTAAAVTQPVEAELYILKLLHILKGLAKCPIEMDSSNSGDSYSHTSPCGSIPLFVNNTLPSLLQKICTLANVQNNFDQILVIICSLFEQYTESYLVSLSSNYITTFYQSSILLLQLIGNRFNSTKNQKYSNVEVQKEEVSFQVELQGHVLGFLNQLAANDFLILEEDNSNNESIYTIIFTAFDLVVIPYLSLELLLPYVFLQEKYFSLLAYISNSCPENLAKKIQFSEVSYGQFFLKNIIDRCLYFINSTQNNISKLTLEILKSLIIYHINSNNEKEAGFGSAIYNNNNENIFLKCLEALMELLISSSLSDASKSIGVDRVDCFANALFAYITYDNNRFNQLVNIVISKQTADTQSTLLVAFQKLVTDHGLVLGNLDRPNRMQFVKNMRDFMSSLKVMTLVV